MEVITAPSFFKSLKDLGSWKNKYNEVRAWFRYHFKKDFIKLLGVVLKSYPWDAGYLYDIEKAKIEEMRKHHEKQQMFVGWEYVVRDMKICERLIDIFTEKELLFDYDGDFTYTKVDGGYKVGTTPDFKYNCKVYVNTKNADRFLPPNIDEKQKAYWINHPHEIYLLKAKYLYHKIRLESDDTWWD